MTFSPREPDLTSARAQVKALIAGSPMAPNPPSVRASAPLGRLPAGLEAKLAGRAASVPPARGAAPPDLWSRIVVPAGLLATLDLLGVVVAVTKGEVLLAVVAGVLFVVLGGFAGLAWRYARRDPLGLTTADRRGLHQASQWRSSQAWTGSLAHGPERGLVLAAARAAERIAATPSWRSGRLDDPRIRLDLVHELDQIDDQAHRIATARAESGPAAGSDPVLAAAEEATLNRVAALTAYADRLDGHDARQAQAQAGLGDPVRDSDLLAGSVRDELALDELIALAYYLAANNADGTASG